MSNASDKGSPGGRKAQRVRIPDRVSIHLRPKIIAKRKQFGHWEGDSIVGDKHASGLHTEYERVSSLTRVEKVNRLTAAEAVEESKKIFGPLPEKARRSTTLDNGPENTKHTEVKTVLAYKHILPIPMLPGSEEEMKIVICGSDTTFQKEQILVQSRMMS